MGEIADYYIERAIYGGPHFDEDEDEGFASCKYCGKEDLAWTQINGEYRLIDENGKVHTCSRPKHTFGPIEEE